MIKRVFLCFIVVMMLFLNFSSIFAYSNQYFSMDIPSDYSKMEQKTMWLFISKSSEVKAIFIYAVPGRNVNKSLKKLSQKEIDDIFAETSQDKDYKIVSTNRNAKLGKEDAIQIDAQSEKAYMNMYILANDQYVYVVMFIAENEETINDTEFSRIKKSFKIKSGGSGFVFLLIAIVIVIFAVKKGGNKNQVIEETPIDNRLQS